MEIVFHILFTFLMYFLVTSRIDLAIPTKTFRELPMLSKLLSAGWHAALVSAIMILYYPGNEVLLLFVIATYFYFILLNITPLVKRKGLVNLFHDGFVFVMYFILLKP
jgi:hypothetical protein